MGSGSDVVSGRDNGFESTTRMVGQQVDLFTPFAGDVIFEVVGIDPRINQGQGVSSTCTAIRGYGTTGDAGPSGTGIWGMGGFNAGTGVLGQGGVVSLIQPSSSGGIGVQGIGGDEGPAPGGGTNTAGAGVFGQGGVGGGTPEHPNAPGVVGLSGGSFAAGVSGEGDPGVLGQGRPSGAAAGVAGFGATGVFGSGSQTGVVGVSERGVGGAFSTAPLQPGDAPSGRGGVFGSRAGEAQVHLVPQPKRPFIQTQTITPGAFTTKGLEALFPANGKAGDLLYTTPAGQTGAPGALWVCTISGTDKRNPAWWQQVLLGPIFTGLG
jgi:hypothetical protein